MVFCPGVPVGHPWLFSWAPLGLVFVGDLFGVVGRVDDWGVVNASLWARLGVPAMGVGEMFWEGHWTRVGRPVGAWRGVLVFCPGVPVGHPWLLRQRILRDEFSSAGVGCFVTPLMIQTAANKFPSRVWEALPEIPGRGVGDLTDLFESDARIFFPEAARSGGQGTTLRSGRSASGAANSCTFAPQKRPVPPPAWRARTIFPRASGRTPLPEVFPPACSLEHC